MTEGLGELVKVGGVLGVVLLCFGVVLCCVVFGLLWFSLVWLYGFSSNDTMATTRDYCVCVMIMINHQLNTQLLEHPLDLRCGDR